MNCSLRLGSSCLWMPHDPRILQRFRCRESLTWFKREQFLNESYAFFSKADFIKCFHRVFAEGYFGHNFGIARASKRWIPSQHDVQDAADGPYITLFIVAAINNFWCHVHGRAEGCTWIGARQRLIAYQRYWIWAFRRLCQMEIYKLNIVCLLLGEDNVFWFKVHHDNMILV